MHSESSQTLLDRAKAFLSNRRAVSVAAAAVVPLAAAPAAEATYLAPWYYADARYASGQTNPGSVVDAMGLTQVAGGSAASGTAQFTLNKTALAEIVAGYTGLNAGAVAVGDRVNYTWSFTLNDSGAVPMDGVQWTLYGLHAVRFGAYTEFALASGSSTGAFAGSQERAFTSAMSDMNWFGMKLLVTAAVAGDQPGQYAMDVNVSQLGFAYTPVPEPSGLLFAAAGGWVLAMRRRGAGRES